MCSTICSYVPLLKNKTTEWYKQNKLFVFYFDWIMFFTTTSLSFLCRTHIYLPSSMLILLAPQALPSRAVSIPIVRTFFFYKQCRTLQFGFGESSGFGLNLKYVHGRFHSLDFSISRFYAVYRSSRFDTLKMHSKHKPGGYHESTRSENVSTPKVISLGLFFLSVSPLPQQSEWSNTVNIRIPS